MKCHQQRTLARNIEIHDLKTRLAFGQNKAVHSLLNLIASPQSPHVKISKQHRETYIVSIVQDLSECAEVQLMR